MILFFCVYYLTRLLLALALALEQAALPVTLDPTLPIQRTPPDYC